MKPRGKSLSLITPVNAETEKKKFRFDPEYNPQFRYETSIPEEIRTKYGPVHTRYSRAARRILDTVIESFETESKYLDHTEGELLPEDTALKIMQHYLQENALTSRVRISVSESFMARTAVQRKDENFVLRVRKPMEYRSMNLEGVLHHEVGTHVFRWMNEMQQPWFQHHRDYQMTAYLETEEGLATLNSLLVSPQPYLWKPALFYLAATLAEEMSFSELFAAISKYVDDFDRAWNVCLRTKRGFTDTSQPGATPKDQAYFKGVYKVAVWIKEEPIEDLYLGKIDAEDVRRLRNTANREDTVLPTFAQNPAYSQQLQSILDFNQIATA